MAAPLPVGTGAGAVEPGEGGAVEPGVGRGLAVSVDVAVPAFVALGSALMIAVICSLYALSRAWISESGTFCRFLP